MRNTSLTIKYIIICILLYAGFITTTSANSSPAYETFHTQIAITQNIDNDSLHINDGPYIFIQETKLIEN